MSLTSMLSDKGSVLSRYLAGRYPNVTSLQREFEAGARPGGLLVPGVSVVDAAMVGVTFTTMVKFDLGPDGDHSMTYAWCNGDSAMGVALRDLVDVVRRDGVGSERGVRACWALSLGIKSYRSGMIDYGLMVAAPTVAGLLGVCPSEAVTQLRQMHRLWVPFRDGLAGAGPAVVAPMFAGSADAGSADANIIVGRTAVAAKTKQGLRVNSWFEEFLPAQDVYQVLCYALLDYDDRYGLREVALWSARYGHGVRWNVNETLSVLRAQPSTLVDERAMLREVLS